MHLGRQPLGNLGFRAPRAPLHSATRACGADVSFKHAADHRRPFHGTQPLLPGATRPAHCAAHRVLVAVIGLEQAAVVGDGSIPGGGSGLRITSPLQAGEFRLPATSKEAGKRAGAQASSTLYFKAVQDALPAVCPTLCHRWLGWLGWPKSPPADPGARAAAAVGWFRRTKGDTTISMLLIPAFGCSRSSLLQQSETRMQGGMATCSQESFPPSLLECFEKGGTYSLTSMSLLQVRHTQSEGQETDRGHTKKSLHHR